MGEKMHVMTTVAFSFTLTRITCPYSWFVDRPSRVTELSRTGALREPQSKPAVIAQFEELYKVQSCCHDV